MIRAGCRVAVVLAALAGGTAWAAAVEAPVASVAHGFYTAPFDVTLSSVTPGALIRYTVDGRAPTDAVGTLYTGPVHISTTTPLRAVASVAGVMSAVTTVTYLFLADVLRQPNAPPGYPATFADTNADGPYPADYEMDPEIVDDPQYADRMIPALLSVPSLSLVGDVDGLFSPAHGIYYNWWWTGPDWERGISIEYLDPSGGEDFSTQAGLRIHGQSSRMPQRTPKKSFRLYFRSTYGDGKLNFPLFGGLPPELDDAAAPQKFDRLLLRGGSNRSFCVFSSYLRKSADYAVDEFGRIAYREMGHLSPYGGRTVHLYINGLYWGLYDTVERVDDNYITAHLGGTAADYDLLAPDTESVTAGYEPVPSMGDTTAWYALLSLVEPTPVTDSAYAQAAQQVDLVNLADYIILTHYLGNTDWPQHNWFAYRHRTGTDTRFRFLAWDNDTAIHTYQDDITQQDYYTSPARVFLRLLTNPQFKQLVSDRLALHTTGDGALTPARCLARYSALTSIVDQAVLGESARWGDYSRDVYRWASAGSVTLPVELYTRDNQWLTVVNYRKNYYCPRRTSYVVAQYTNNGWYLPRPKAPAFSQRPGNVPDGFTLDISNPNTGIQSSIYYTTDGSDPRLDDGSVAPTARNGGSLTALPITKVTTVTARVQAGADWSPPTRGSFYPPQDFSQLVINEVNYHPLPPAGASAGGLEFVELFNKGDLALRLDNATLSRGISYTFPLATALAPGHFLVLASNAVDFQARYGFAPAGQYDGNLANAGDTLELRDGVGALIASLTYTDLPPWPVEADGTGASLELDDPQADITVPGNWHPSSVMGGTPGAANSPRVVVSVSSSSGPTSSSSLDLASSSTSLDGASSSLAAPSSSLDAASSSAGPLASSAADPSSSSSSLASSFAAGASSSSSALAATSSSTGAPPSSADAPSSSAGTLASSAGAPSSAEAPSSSAGGLSSSAAGPASSGVAPSSSGAGQSSSTQTPGSSASLGASTSGPEPAGSSSHGGTLASSSAAGASSADGKDDGGAETTGCTCGPSAASPDALLLGLLGLLGLRRRRIS